MNLENNLLPFYIMSLPWNDSFSFKTALNSIKKINENSTITKKQLDELQDFNRSEDIDVYEFLEIPRLSTRKTNGYRAALNLCYENKKTNYLELTKTAKEILKLDSFDEQIKLLFLIMCLYYPHIRALLEVLFSKKIYFKATKENIFPSGLKKYYILHDNKNLEEILLNIWNSENNEFLKQFILNQPIFDLIRDNLRSENREKIIISSNKDILFSEKDFKDNKFKILTSKTCVNLIGLRNNETRRILFDYNHEGDNLYSIKLKENLLYTKIFDYSMKDFLPANLTSSKLELIDKSIIENYTLDEFYTLQELLFDLEDLGFKETEILDWKLNIEKNQRDNTSFESILLNIKTKSGVMGALGLLNKTKHAKLKFLRKEV